MPKEDETDNCKLRFKGIENFLRRIAFNLGNTPSQTEVKIISCIPIDVTDLQQKIVQLEMQLADARHAKEAREEQDKNVEEKSSARDQTSRNYTKKATNGSKHASIDRICAALCESTFPQDLKSDIHTVKPAYCQSNTQNFDDASLSKKKSAINYLFSTTPVIKEIDPFLEVKQSKAITEENNHAVAKEPRRNIFKKTKKLSKKATNSHLVYYTETDCNQYRSHKRTHSTKEMSGGGDKLISSSYISDMIRKQYQSMQILDEVSDTSQFTSPLCRDVEQDFQHLYDSDLCSCCHGAFQNIDKYLRKTSEHIYSTSGVNRNDYQTRYYDSSLYDLIPVKEKPIKNRKEFDSSKRKDTKIDIQCWPETVRVKPKCQPLIIHCHTIIPKKRDKMTYAKFSNKIHDHIAPLKQTRFVKKVDQQTEMESSKTCLVAIENVYSKHLPKLKTVTFPEYSKPLLKNDQCLRTMLKQSEFNNCTRSTMKTVSGNKTDVTINQIKHILQSVLTEVKTNSQLKVSKGKTKKDACVQNVQHQNNMQNRSDFLNSFTYSSSNRNRYGPCSKLTTPNYMYYSAMQPINFSENCPQIIQRQGNHLCTGCFRNSQGKTYSKITTTTATNTDDFQEKRNNETEKLIQKIYKSVALEVSTKHDDLKSNKIIMGSCNFSKQDKEVRVAVTEIFNNRNVTLDSSKTNATLNNKIPQANISRSHLTSANTNTDNHIAIKITKSFVINKNIQLPAKTELETRKEITLYGMPAKLKKGVSRTISKSNESKNSSNTESDDTVISTKAKVKKMGRLFHRMFQIFYKDKNKNKEETIPEESDISDSNDYQTVYSHKREVPKDTNHVTRQIKADSKVFHSRPVQERSPERPRRMPYMEQEQRRYWNEELMFQNQKPKCTSERPFSKDTPQRSLIHQNHESKSVSANPHTFYHPQLNQQKRKDVADNPRLGQQGNNTANKGAYKNVIKEDNAETILRDNIAGKILNPNKPSTVITDGNVKAKKLIAAGNENLDQVKLKGPSWLTKFKIGNKLEKNNMSNSMWAAMGKIPV